MTVDQVFQLLEKGFTRDDIMKLESVKAEGIQEPKEEPKKEEPKKDPAEEPKKDPPEEPKKDPPEKKEEPKKDPAEEPKKDPREKTETEKRLDSIESNIASLVKAIQQQNLKNDHFDNPADTLEEQTDKIMASIIRPEPAKKGD